MWAENSIKQKGNYLIWITFNLTQGVAKLRIDHSIPFEMFVTAFQVKFLNGPAAGKGRGKRDRKGR